MYLLQPPPPNPATNDLGFISLPTVTMMIVLAFLIQASMVMFNSRMVREYKGIRLVVWAAFILALQYAILFAFLPGKFVGTTANALTNTGH